MESVVILFCLSLNEQRKRDFLQDTVNQLRNTFTARSIKIYLIQIPTNELHVTPN